VSIDPKFVYSLEVRLIDLEKRFEELSDKVEAALQRATGQDGTEAAGLPASVLERIKRGEHPVKAIRLHRLMTQKDLGAACGIRPNHISSIERGTPYGLKTAKRLAEALDVPVDMLL